MAGVQGKMRILAAVAVAPLAPRLRLRSRDRSRSAARTRVRKPVAERTGAPRGQALARRQVRHAPKNRPDDKDRYDLWAIDTATGAQRMLVESQKIGTGGPISEEEKMRRERLRIAGTKGITEYEWAPDSKSILVPIDGDIYLAALDGSVRRLTNTATTEIDAKVSEAGKYLSFLRDQNLFVIDRSTGREQALTSDGSGTLSWGAAEFIAQEELGRHTGYWWSPDDRYIAVARVDESPVAVVKRAAIGASGTSSDRATVSRCRHEERDRRSLCDDARRKVSGEGRSRIEPGLLSRARRLGDGRAQPLRPTPQPGPEAARHAPVDPRPAARACCSPKRRRPG